MPSEKPQSLVAVCFVIQLPCVAVAAASTTVCPWDSELSQSTAARESYHFSKLMMEEMFLFLFFLYFAGKLLNSTKKLECGIRHVPAYLSLCGMCENY